jgi:hypothetical protein
MTFFGNEPVFAHRARGFAAGGCTCDVNGGTSIENVSSRSTIVVARRGAGPLYGWMLM